MQRLRSLSHIAASVAASTMALSKVLEAFDAAITQAEESDAYHKTARKSVAVIESLIATVDGLPEELRPTMPTDEEIARLRSLSGQTMSPELQGLKAKVEAALTLGEDAGLVDFDADAAKALVDRYKALATNFGSRRGSSGERIASGVRALSHPIRVTCGSDKARLSGGQTGNGDWTWVRWQMTDHAKDHDGIAKEALDTLRNEIVACEAGSGGPVDTTVVAGDGTEYRVEFPA